MNELASTQHGQEGPDTSVLLVLAGRPYSGKSSVATHLERSGFTVIELDTINQERGFAIEHGVPMTEWPETVRIAQARIRRCFTEGRGRVALSWVNPTKRDRALWVAFGASCGVPVRTAWMDCPLSVTEERRLLTGSGRHALSAEVIDRVERRLETPGADEDVMTFDAASLSSAKIASKLATLVDSPRH
ncbi:AAA family ATPase [Propionibacteriaceae bacterium Y2011]